MTGPKIGCDKICFGLAGLPVLVPRIRASHQSSPRVFETLSLKTLEQNKCRFVIRQSIKEANEKNKDQVAIHDEAMESIVQLSDGYPHFIHLYADRLIWGAQPFGLVFDFKHKKSDPVQWVFWVKDIWRTAPQTTGR